MAEPAIWLEMVKVGATLAAAGAAAYVAYTIGSSQRDIAVRQADTAAAQRKVSEAKLNLDLFEERYALFEKVWGFLSTGPNQSESINASLRPEFTNLIPRAQFLFGSEIADFMRDASKRRIDLAVAHVQLTSGNMPPDLPQKIAEMETWFHTEASNCFKRFAPYLDFSVWKADPLERLLSKNAA